MSGHSARRPRTPEGGQGRQAEQGVRQASRTSRSRPARAAVTSPATPRSTTPSRRPRRRRSRTTTSTAPSNVKVSRGRRVRLADHHVRGVCAGRGRCSPSASPTTAPGGRRGSDGADPQRRRRPTGSAAYVFDRRGVVIVPKSNGLTEDDLLEVVLDAGAEEVNDNGDSRDRLGRLRLRRDPHRGPGRGHRLRVRRGLLGAEPAGPARPRRRPQDDPGHRRVRGQRRRPERLRQRRDLRRRPRGASTRTSDEPGVGALLRGSGRRRG